MCWLNFVIGVSCLSMLYCIACSLQPCDHMLGKGLTLEAPRKNASKSSAAIIANITDELSIEANSVDPEQTAYIGAV